MAKKDEYISIKEFSKRAGLSTQSVYKRLNQLHNPLNQYVKQVANKKMLNIRALNEIYNIEVVQPLQPNDATYATKVATENTMIDQQIIDILQEELKSKDKQIENLQKLIDQEQQLHMAEKKRVLELESKAEDVYEKTWFGLYKKKK